MEEVIKKSIEDLKANDIVKTCKSLECGVGFWIDGIHCCCVNTYKSPTIITAEEMRSGKVNYNLIVERRKELFGALNGLNDKDAGDCLKCSYCHETEFKNVNFEYLGGHGICSGFNIQHFSTCNLRCKYCAFTIDNNFVPPQYDNIIDFIEEYTKRDKLIRGEWIEYNGGEPTLLDNFEKILDYLVDNNIGGIGLFSNAVIYSESIYQALKQNKLYLTTSLDAGTPSTFKKLRGADAYHKVINNLIRYKNSGTDNLWIKYIICDENRTEDDLWGFVMAMIAIRPGQVYIAPSFPYGDMEIPKETAEFGAKMWYLLEKYGGITPHIQSDDAQCDPKFPKFSKDIREQYNRIKEENSYGEGYNLLANRPSAVTTQAELTPEEQQLQNINEKLIFIEQKLNKPTLLQQLFSVTNDDNHKAVRIFGIKMKFKQNKKRR